MPLRRCSPLKRIQQKQVLRTGKPSDFRPLLCRYFGTTNSTTTVFVAMSGGVDSAVAAALLVQRQQQHEKQRSASDISDSMSIVGLHMSNWNVHDDDSAINNSNRGSIRNKATCSSDQDWEDASVTARHLNIPMTRLRHLESDYWCHVFEPYIQTLHETGAMGNPDIACNARVKFGALLAHCLQQKSADHQCRRENTVAHASIFLATGHYARLWHRCPKLTARSVFLNETRIPQVVEEAASNNESDAGSDLDWLRQWGDGSSTLLLAAADKKKDQSYFLSACPYTAFSQLIFPLGELHKSSSVSPPSPSSYIYALSVRDLAAQWNLPVANKQESMGICFVGKRQGGFGSFVAEYLPIARHILQFVDVDTQQVVHETASEQHACLYTSGQGVKLSGAPEKYFCVDNNWNPQQQDKVTLSQNGMVGLNSSIPGNQQQQQQQQHHQHYHTSCRHHVVSVCKGTHHPALYSDSLILSSIHWLCASPPPMLLQQGFMRSQCRIRHLQPLVDCTIFRLDDQNSITVCFDIPIRGITRGQMAVFYALNGLVCLGGGSIAARGETYFEQNRQLPSTLHPAGLNDLSLFRRAASA